MQLMGVYFWFLIIVIPVVPTVYNVWLLFRKPITGKKRVSVLIFELVCMAVGTCCTMLFCAASNIRDSDWFEPIYVGEKHTPILLDGLPMLLCLVGVALIGYVVLTLVNRRAMPPLCAVLCIAAMYLGTIECILWCVQISKDVQDVVGVLYYILPLNLMLIFARAIRDVVWQHLEADGDAAVSESRLHRVVSRAKNWPWLALVLAAPLLGVILVLLLLFGQKPDYIITMWTETADWTMSTKVPPQSLYPDGHYLCTVAAGGHRRVVKPIRTGLRHGHTIVVNRQLMVANAFEQLLEERTPRFHKVVRAIYDAVGYPIAQHIKAPIIADAIYVMMKPLEWGFLTVLYLFDTKPENRIAVQYPHSQPPCCVERA